MTDAATSVTSGHDGGPHPGGPGSRGPHPGGPNDDGPYSDDDRVDIGAALAAAVEHLGLTGAELVGDGLESCVYRARSATLGEVAVRVPRYRWYRLPEREPFTALRNLRQEYDICAVLHAAGLPVAEPLRLCAELPIPVLVSRYVPTQRLGAPPEQIGALLADLHAAPVPLVDPLDHDGGDIVTATGNRTHRRWRRLHQRVPDLPPPPPLARLREVLAPAGRAPLRLLHLDVRACNILTVDGRIAALVDWSCAMLGHPAAELARVEEYAQLAENELDAPAIRAGYATRAPIPPVAPELDALLRLDAVTMLGVLFAEYAPDAERAAWALDRVNELGRVLHHHLRRS